MRLAVSTTETRISWWHAVRTDRWANAWSWTCGESWIGAEHADAGAKLGSTERDHVLADMAGDNLPMLWVGVGQDVLDQIVTVLVAGNVDEGNARAVWTALADAIQIATEKLHSTNFETLLNYLGCKLVHAVLRGVSDDMIDGAAAISWSTMLTDVLNTPVSELTVGDDVDAAKDFLNAWTLLQLERAIRMGGGGENVPCPPLSNSRRYSAQPDFPSHQEQPRATCHEEPR